jgi:glutathione-regulated potassium-efflux system protein KefB
VFESAICMARQAMTSLEIDPDDIQRAEDQYRDVDGRRLAAQAQANDLHAGEELMIRPSAGAVPIPAESG